MIVHIKKSHNSSETLCGSSVGGDDSLPSKQGIACLSKASQSHGADQDQDHVGVVLDDYKVAKWTAALTAAGFVDIEVFSNNDKTSLIKVPISVKGREQAIREIGQICTKCEFELAGAREAARRN